MKRYLMFIMIVALGLIIFGCAEKPASVADKFLNAMQKNDVETMKSLSTEESLKAIEFIGMMQAESKLIKSYKIMDTEVNGDVAKVKYSLELTEEFKGQDEGDEKAKEETLTLQRKEGKWKVHIEKDGMQK